MGGSSTPDITQIETMSPEQKKFLNTMLDIFPQIMTGQTIGEQWGGTGTKTKPFTIPGAGEKGSVLGSEQKKDIPEGQEWERKKSSAREILKASGASEKKQSPLSDVLTGPITSPFTQGQTGNYPKRGG